MKKYIIYCIATFLSSTFTGICFSQVKNISLLKIPSFDPHSSMFRGVESSATGVYVYFLNSKSSEEIKSTYVHKQYGSNSWKETKHNRLITSIFPVDIPNDDPAKISFYWSGSKIPDLNNINQLTSADQLEYIGGYGLYNLNTDIPSFEYLGRGTILKLVVDKSPYRTVWLVGLLFNSMNLMEMPTLYNVYSSTRAVHQEGGSAFDPVYEIQSDSENEEIGSLFDPSRNILTASTSEKDSHVLFASGKSIMKISSKTRVEALSLSSFGGPEDVIKKIVEYNSNLWALIGNDIVLIKDGQAKKVYTFKSSGLHSFAVDNSFLYTSDGYKISINFNTKEILIGSTSPADQNNLDQFKKVMESCIVATSGNATDPDVYFVDPINGRIFKIQK